jgi:ribosomal protein S18 acetylase RimI-like enzyme
VAEPLVLPAALAEAGVSLRPETPDDRAFLERLHFLVRRDEFAPAGWPEPVLESFLAGQFDLQRRQYAAMHPDGEFYVILAGAAPVGRFYVDRSARTFVLVEISLLPEWRGRGVGRALIGALIDAAGDGRADRVALSVTPHNPARRLYRRLGFDETRPPSEFAEAHVEMARTVS